METVLGDGLPAIRQRIVRWLTAPGSAVAVVELDELVQRVAESEARGAAERATASRR